MIDNLLEKSVLGEFEKEFNQTIVYGRDTDLISVLSMAKRYPMMSEYQLVIVREAQDLKDLFKKKKGDEDELSASVSKPNGADKDLLSDYLSSPMTSTILIFCYKHKPVDKRTKAYKSFEKSAACMETKRLYDDKIPGWILSYVKNKGFSISDPSAALLNEYLGNDLSKISNELDKLLINLEKGTEISGEIIEQGIGISKDFNVFELQTALAKKDILKANRIVNYFGANPRSNPFVLTIGTLHSFFNKIITYHALKNVPGINLATALKVHPFFMKEYEMAARNYSLESCIWITGWLHQFDLMSKGVGNRSADSNELLRELVFRILHPQSVPEQINE